MEKNSPKSMVKIIGINLLLFAVLFGLVSLNKEILRPRFNHIAFVRILTGSIPNFIAAYIISVMLVNAVFRRKPKNGNAIVYFGSTLVFVILTIEELLPMWEASTHYDALDIVASGLGSALAIITYKLIKRKVP
jgi:hypothetical protein